MALFEDSGETDANEKTDGGIDANDDATDVAADPVALAAAGSVLFSWYLFYLKGNKEQGVFVGLWAPTLLSAANYFKHLDLSEKLDKGLSFR